MNTAASRSCTRLPPSSVRSRFLGAWWGMLIGDALAVPSHGYYNIAWIERDYGIITGYVPVKEPHPNCDMPRIRYSITNEKDNILHRRESLWKMPGTHYHHGLKPGDNTLPATIAVALAESIGNNAGTYNRDDFVSRYTQLMLSPDGHRDTYIPAAHRRFFENYGRGLPPEKCAGDDAHIAGLVETSPLLLALCGATPQVNRHLRHHLQLAHPDSAIVHAADLLAEILTLLLTGDTLENTIYKRLGHHRHPFFAYPYHRWIAHHTDENVAMHNLSIGPLIDDAMPLALYVALKYARDFETALQMNAGLGGDSCNRGAIVGLLLGAQFGCEGIPEHLAGGLTEFEKLAKLGDALWETAEKSLCGEKQNVRNCLRQ